MKSLLNLSNNNQNLVKLTPLFLLSLNLILKIIFITSTSIGGDEPFSIYHAQLDIPEIIKMLSSENNPPLHFFFLHYWIKIFGISALSVRIPSLIFSTLTVYFIYKIGKSFFNYRVALIASLLFTFSNMHILFAHEARVYPLFALLTAMSMFYFLKICNSESSFKNYSFLLIINVLLLYAHYFGFFVIFIQLFTTLLFKETRLLFRKNLLYLSALIILYIPNLYILFTRFRESTSHGTWVEPPNGIESLYNMLWHYSNKPLTTVLAIVILTAAFIKYIIKKDYKTKSNSGLIVTLWFIFPFLFMFFISYWIPMFIDRYLIFVSLAYYLLLAVCSSYLFSKATINLIVPSILVLLFAFTFNPNVDNKRHVKETVQKVIELKDKNTKVLICPQFFIYSFAYYYSPEIFQNVHSENPYDLIQKNLRKQNVYTINNINEVDLNDCNKVIYLDAAADFTFPENNILKTLENQFTLKNTFKYYEIFTVYEFVKENKDSTEQVM